MPEPHDPALPDLAALIALVDRAADDGPLEQIGSAEELAADLNRLGDRLIGYFIERARAHGYSWSDIGAHLGITRQAAQQRYTPRWSSLTLADLADAGALARLTARTREALHRAEDHARRLRHTAVEPEHVMLAVLDDAETLAVKALRTLKSDPARLRRELTARLPPGAADPPAAIALHARTRRCLDASVGEALDLGHNYIGTEHVLLGVLHDRHGVAALLADRGVTLDGARQAIRTLISEHLRRG